MKGSVTQNNTRITVLSDILQTARKLLVEGNPSKIFLSDETRRIILVCLIYFATRKEKMEELQFLSEIVAKRNLAILSNIWFDEQIDISSINISGAIAEINTFYQYPDWKEQLVYLCEALEYDTNSYFAASIHRGVRNRNTHKKRRGIYYTPKDIVDFMVSRCMEAVHGKDTCYPPSFLDCSCGSGVFLLHALSCL